MGFPLLKVRLEAVDVVQMVPLFPVKVQVPFPMVSVLVALMLELNSPTVTLYPFPSNVPLANVSVAEVPVSRFPVSFQDPLLPLKVMLPAVFPAKLTFCAVEEVEMKETAEVVTLPRV